MACGCERDGGRGRYLGHHGGSCGCGRGCHHGDRCCCGSHFHASPAFWTRDEKVAWLESRLEELQEQVRTIQERIAVLKAEG
jgi:hypothetical protein